eukprot:TRINITY_DN1674_c0_g2_i10.p1 TRINITY_DN1674_c0_g2~~TRINITY_DN1674_c0_g2_i10.p1  ORF type:complete len:283 (+),score=49.87 TRINITY_DN1674_c0_g2_i10:168-1016(+)
MVNSMEKAIQRAVSAKNIILLAGAGISVASGLPTYRGKDGLWTRKTLHKNPQLTATKAYFDMNPYECWKRSYIFYNKMLESKPNICHYSILAMQKAALSKNVELNLVTQNIDGYHADLIKETKLFANPEVSEGMPMYGYTNGVYEIHGNLHYMRCSVDFCSNRYLYRVPPVYNEYESPKCKKCGSPMRRNTLMFDEAYNELYYKSQTVLKKANDHDLLVIAGTELKTALPKRIVYATMDRNVDVVEFNLRSWVPDYPNQMIVEGPCEMTMPKFVEGYLKAIS